MPSEIIQLHAMAVGVIPYAEIGGGQTLSTIEGIQATLKGPPIARLQLLRKTASKPLHVAPKWHGDDELVWEWVIRREESLYEYSSAFQNIVGELSNWDGESCIGVLALWSPAKASVGVRVLIHQLNGV